MSRRVSRTGSEQINTDSTSSRASSTGARTALLVGFASSFVGATFGLVLGVASAYFGGKIDLIFQRILDVFMAFPLIILALAVIAIFGTGAQNVIIAITIPFIPRCARVVRSSALAIRELPYIDAARANGFSHSRIILRHMASNVMAPFLIMITAFVVQAILLEASLSYLGLGVQEPTPAWGLMLQGGAEEYAESAPGSPSSQAPPSVLRCSVSACSAMPYATSSIPSCDPSKQARHGVRSDAPARLAGLVRTLRGVVIAIPQRIPLVGAEASKGPSAKGPWAASEARRP